MYFRVLRNLLICLTCMRLISKQKLDIWKSFSVSLTQYTKQLGNFYSEQFHLFGKLDFKQKLLFGRALQSLSPLPFLPKN